MANRRFGWHSGDMIAWNADIANAMTVGGDTTMTGSLTISGSLTFGDASVDNFILKGRTSTMTAGGAAIDIDASTYQYTEGFELRYSVSDWADTYTLTNFRAMYVRADTTEASSNSVYGMEIYGVTNNVNVGSIWGILSYAYVKGATAKSIANAYGIQTELTFDAGSGTNTVSGELTPLLCKITGGVCNDYTKIHGMIIRSGDMDGGSRTYGNAIQILDDTAMTGAITWTTGINLNQACTTGISVAGATTTAISLSGDATTGISITSGMSATNVISIAATASTAGINISGDCTTAIQITGQGTSSIGIQQTVSGATQYVVGIQAIPTLATDGNRGGYLYIGGDRATVWTATGGNPDTGLKIRMENNSDSPIGYGGVRCIDAMARNDDASACCTNIHTAYLTAENTDDINTECADMEVLQLIMSNQGVVDTSLYGLRVLENSEGTVPTDTVGIKVTTSTNAPAGGTRADGMMITTGGATGGWTDGLHIAGTITNAINVSGTHTQGIYLGSGSCTAGLVMGEKSSVAAVGHHIGVANSADNAGDKAIAVFCDDANATLLSDAQGINSRCLIMHAQAGAYAMDALRGHLRGVASITPSAQKAFSATSGYVEMSGTYTIGDATHAVFMCGMSSTVELGGTPTISAHSRICGIHLNGNFASAINGATAPSVGVMYEAGALGYGYQFALGFHDGISGMLSTASDTTNVSHKVAVWINGVGTRYIHLFTD